MVGDRAMVNNSPEGQRMTHERLMALMDEEYGLIREAFARKAADYGSAGDALIDFKEAALDAGVPVQRVWLIWVVKHWNAVKTFVRTGKLESEGIEPRIRDVIGYQILLLALLEDTVAKEMSENATRGVDQTIPTPSDLEPLGPMRGH